MPFTKKPLSQRILISGLVAIPVDIIIVLIGLSYAAPGAMPINAGNMGLMFVSNMSSVVIIFFLVRNLEKKKKVTQVLDEEVM